MTNICTRSTSVKTLVTVSALLLLMLSLACTRTDPAPTPTVPQVTAAEVVDLSRTAMRDLDSFSFEMTHASGFTALSGSLKLTRASGLVATNGLDLEAEANIGRAFVRVEAVVIGEQTWMTNPLTGVWSEIAPEDSPFSFLDPVKLVADILGDTRQAAYAADSPSNGEFTIVGTIPSRSLAALVGSVEPDAVPEVELTLDAESHLLKKIVISGIVQPTDDEDTVRVITLSEFDIPNSLEPPI